MFLLDRNDNTESIPYTEEMVVAKRANLKYSAMMPGIRKCPKRPVLMLSHVLVRDAYPWESQRLTMLNVPTPSNAKFVLPDTVG